MPEPLNTDAIQKAYLEPIRTVILVDDGFPTYDRLSSVNLHAQDSDLEPSPAGVSAVSVSPSPALYHQSVTAETSEAAETHAPAAEPATKVEASPGISGQSGKEYDRARALWTACRERGYLCDIDDGAQIEASIPKHITKSDLVVLDYHLQGESPSLALKLLRHLAGSEHARLVVVYTADQKLEVVRRRVIAHLRGAKSLSKLFDAAALIRWQDLDWNPALSVATLDSFLRGDRDWRGDKDLRKELTNKGVSSAEAARMIEAALESYLADTYGVPAMEEGHPRRVEVSGPAAPRFWVHTDNLFVAFLSKTNENMLDGSEVFQAAHRGT